jgi:hypothetical protein
MPLIYKGKIPVNAMLVYGGLYVRFRSFLTWALDEGRGVSFTPRPLYPQRIIHRYLLNRRIVGPQERSGHFREEESILLCRESNH